MKRKTATGRFGRGLKRIGRWCRWHRHEPVALQHAALNRKLKGHYGYYGITGNWRALNGFCRQVERLWRSWLSRRSRHRADMNWEKFQRLLQHYPLAPPRVVHSIYRGAANP